MLGPEAAWYGCAFSTCHSCQSVLTVLHHRQHSPSDPLALCQLPIHLTTREPLSSMTATSLSPLTLVPSSLAAQGQIPTACLSLLCGASAWDTVYFLSSTVNHVGLGVCHHRRILLAFLIYALFVPFCIQRCLFSLGQLPLLSSFL